MILSVETSTTVCSAALHNEGKLVAFEIVHTPNSAAGQLAVMIDRVLSKSSRPLKAVAVSSGPGSYTGLRIGVATAKGICYALSLPLIAVSSLEIMAFQVHSQATTGPQQLLCPMIDARRMEVYTALFDASLKLVSPVEAKVIDATSFESELRQREIYFFGNGSGKIKPVLTHPGARFIDDIFPSAEWMGGLAFSAYNEGRFENVADFEPAYLKDFIAKKPKSLV